MRRAVGWTLGLGLSATLACSSLTSFEQDPSWPTPVRGAVVTEHPLATQVGLDVLARGGNAADAAVAAALTLAVVYPQAGNLGGGGFALWVPHEGKPVAIDFRETAPAKFEPGLFLDERGEVQTELSRTTPLAVGVPGTPAGLYELFRFGSGVSLLKVCSDAIALAEVGFPVDPWLARDLRDQAVRSKLERNAAARALFYPGGEALSVGQKLVQPALARTLMAYSRFGIRGFYEGEVARSMVAALDAVDLTMGKVSHGASLSLEDLAAYQVKMREPVIGWFRGTQVIGMPPPSSGGIALLQALTILDGLPLDAERRRALTARERGLAPGVGPDGVSARALHWWAEAQRLAFADRAQHLGDPDHYQVPVDALLSAEGLAQRRVGIGERADFEVAATAAWSPPESSETTHLSVIDADGNAVSLTTTLNASFGSGILVPEAGFLLNNEIDDFSIKPGTPNLYGLVGTGANQLQANKRPLSSMTPTVLREGGRSVSAVLGAPGGPKIITAVMQVLLRTLVYEQDPESAVRAPRLHQQWVPAETRFEEGWSVMLLDALQGRHGHLVEVRTGETFGSVQGIWIGEDGEPLAISDPRRGGAGGIQGKGVSEPARPGDPIQAR